MTILWGEASTETNSNVLELDCTAKAVKGVGWGGVGGGRGGGEVLWIHNTEWAVNLNIQVALDAAGKVLAAKTKIGIAQKTSRP